MCVSDTGLWLEGILEAPCIDGQAFKCQSSV